jgi:ABC-type antimicrobial peptide transport system permease subunit
MSKSFERQRHLIDFTIASVLRRKGKNGALLFVYALIIFILASVLFLTRSLRDEAAAVLRDSPEIIVQRTLTGRFQFIPLDYADSIRAIRGIASIKPRLWGYYYDGAFGANYTLMVPLTDTIAEGTITLGSGIARLRKLQVGDIVPFTGYDGIPRTFTIAGILNNESSLVAADLVLMNGADYRALSGIPPGYAMDLVLSVRNPREFSTIADKITRILPDTRPIVKNEILRTYDAVFSWRAGIVLLIFAGSVLAFFILSFDKATGLSAEERKETGILKALGWETADVLAMKFWEGIVISLFAFFIGILSAYAHVYIGGASLFTPILKGWSTLYPAFTLTPHFNAGDLLSLFFLSVVPYTIATIAPSWRVATIDPDSVMR